MEKIYFQQVLQKGRPWIITFFMIESDSLDLAMDLLRDRLRTLGDPPLHFVGQRGTDAFALKALLCFIDYPIHTVICLDASPDHEAIGAAAVYSLERQILCRNTWYSRELSRLFRQMKIELPEKSLLFAYSLSPEMAEYCGRRGIRILSPEYRLQHYLQGKIALTEVLSQENLPMMPHCFAPIADLTYGKCRDFFSVEKLVFQHVNGASGSGTFFVSEEAAFEALKSRFPGSTIFKVAPFYPSYSYAVTGCITDRGTIWDPPAVQVIGDSAVGILSPRPAIYSGSDFFHSAFLSETFFQSPIPERFGRALFRKGYRGIFNIDLLAGGTYILDLNARCPGSIRMITELELANGQIPLILYQLLHYLDVKIAPGKDRRCFGKNASLLVMHSLSPEPVTLKSRLLPGIYGSSENSIQRIRNGSGMADLKAENEFLLTGGVPAGTVSVMPEAPIGRIWVKKSVVDHRMQLRPEFSSLAAEVYGKMGMPTPVNRIVKVTREDEHIPRKNLSERTSLGEDKPFPPGSPENQDLFDHSLCPSADPGVEQRPGDSVSLQSPGDQQPQKV